MRNGPYTLLLAPETYPGKRYRGKYAYEHRIIWWRFYGELPPAGYEIHHVNGDHKDNKIDNLTLLTSQRHKRYHADLRIKPLIKFKCAYCAKDCALTGSKYRTRARNSKYGKIFCSARCGAKHQHMVAGVGQGDTSLTVNQG